MGASRIDYHGLPAVEMRRRWRLCTGHVADLPDNGYRNMLCIEAARIEKPVCLQAGEHWGGLQHLALRR